MKGKASNAQQQMQNEVEAREAMDRLTAVVGQAFVFQRERGIASPGEGFGYLKLSVDHLGDTIDPTDVRGIALLDALDRIESVIHWATVFYLTLDSFREDALAKAKLAEAGEGEQDPSSVPEADPVPSV